MMKRIIFLFLTFQLLYAQSLADELKKLDWPSGWNYQLSHDQDTGSPLKKFFNTFISISYNDTVKGNFYVCECNQKNDFCYVTLDPDDWEGPIRFTPFGDAVMNYRFASKCPADPSQRSIVSFIWKRRLFLTAACPCVPGKHTGCKDLETILMALFGYEPGVPYDYIKSMK
jgi:hypothetical protein